MDGLAGAAVGLGGCDGIAEIPCKQKEELEGEPCSKTPTKLPIFQVCFLLESVS